MQALLLDTENGSRVPCEVEPLRLDHVEAANVSWCRELERRCDMGFRDEDILVWRQGLNYSECDYDLAPSGYVISAAGEIQGVVTFDRALQSDQDQHGSDLVYVSYLATAPWNRPSGNRLGQFQGVGRLLVAVAVVESIARGCDGRIGLHALVGASGFYDRLGFVSRGIDPSLRGMAFFKLSSGATERVLCRESVIRGVPAFERASNRACLRAWP